MLSVHTIDKLRNGRFYFRSIMGGLVSENSLVAVYRVNNQAVLLDWR